jgi:hypothetical protein
MQWTTFEELSTREREDDDDDDDDDVKLQNLYSNPKWHMTKTRERKCGEGGIPS